MDVCFICNEILCLDIVLRIMGQIWDHSNTDYQSLISSTSSPRGWCGITQECYRLKPKAMAASKPQSHKYIENKFYPLSLLLLVKCLLGWQVAQWLEQSSSPTLSTNRVSGLTSSTPSLLGDVSLGNTPKLHSSTVGVTVVSGTLITVLERLKDSDHDIFAISLKKRA